MSIQKRRCTVSSSHRTTIRLAVGRVIERGILAGQVEAVIRPDGLIGYQLTDAGKAWLEARKS